MLEIEEAFNILEEEYEKTIVAQDLILKAQEKIIKELQEKKNDKLVEKLVKNIFKIDMKNEILQLRIDKAIEYAEKHIGIRIGDDFIPTNKELLNILKGEDNDSK